MKFKINDKYGDTVKIVSGKELIKLVKKLIKKLDNKKIKVSNIKNIENAIDYFKFTDFYVIPLNKK